MMTKKTVQVLSLALIAYLVVAPGTDRASAYERKFYKDTPEFNDEHYVVSPYQDVDNPHLTTVYEAPWKSKGLVPVKLTLKEKLAPLVLFADGKPKAKIITIKSSAYYLDCATLVKKYLDLATGGSFEIVDDDGTVIEVTEKAWLCRCGHSTNKPFCDGSHSKAGFTDPRP